MHWKKQIKVQHGPMVLLRSWSCARVGDRGFAPSCSNHQEGKLTGDQHVASLGKFGGYNKQQMILSQYFPSQGSQTTFIKTRNQSILPPYKTEKDRYPPLRRDSTKDGEGEVAPVL